MPLAARATSLIAVASIALAACAGTEARSSAVTWRKSGVDDDAMRVEFGLCGGDFDGFGAPRFDPAAFAAIDACMRAKGFVPVTP